MPTGLDTRFGHIRVVLSMWRDRSITDHLQKTRLTIVNRLVALVLSPLRQVRVNDHHILLWLIQHRRNAVSLSLFPTWLEYRQANTCEYLVIGNLCEKDIRMRNVRSSALIVYQTRFPWTRSTKVRLVSTCHETDALSSVAIVGHGVESSTKQWSTWIESSDGNSTRLVHHPHTLKWTRRTLALFCSGLSERRRILPQADAHSWEDFQQRYLIFTFS